MKLHCLAKEGFLFSALVRNLEALPRFAKNSQYRLRPFVIFSSKGLTHRFFLMPHSEVWWQPRSAIGSGLLGEGLEKCWWAAQGQCLQPLILTTFLRMWWQRTVEEMISDKKNNVCFSLTYFCLWSCYIVNVYRHLNSALFWSDACHDTCHSIFFILLSSLVLDKVS